MFYQTRLGCGECRFLCVSAVEHVEQQISSVPVFSWAHLLREGEVHVKTERLMLRHRERMEGGDPICPSYTLGLSQKDPHPLTSNICKICEG